MSFFSPSQRKVLLLAWPLVLLVLYCAVMFMGRTEVSEVTVDAALLMAFVVAIPMQLTAIVYFIAGVTLLALWFYGGRQRNLCDYALIVLTTAIIFTVLLRDVPLNLWQSF